MWWPESNGDAEGAGAGGACGSQESNVWVGGSKTSAVRRDSAGGEWDCGPIWPGAVAGIF